MAEAIARPNNKKTKNQTKFKLDSLIPVRLSPPQMLFELPLLLPYVCAHVQRYARTHMRWIGVAMVMVMVRHRWRQSTRVSRSNGEKQL